MPSFPLSLCHLLRAAMILILMAGTWVSAADGSGLIGAYFNSSDLSGTRVVRTDATVDFDWAGGSPLAGIGADHFSVRWTGEVEAPVSGAVTFSTLSDDGVRLWVDGQLIIDHWNDHGAFTDLGVITLVAGQRYPIRMEFYENGGAALAKLRWSATGLPMQVVPQAKLYPSLPIGTGTGLLAAYYDQRDLSGPALRRTDATVDFNWAGGSPDSVIAADTFSARWMGEIEPRFSEVYTFTTTTDDGVRLWVGGQLLVDRWSDQSATTLSGTIALSAGMRYPLVMEYYENGGAAVARLAWSSPSTPSATVPASQLFPVAPVGSGSGLLAQYYDERDLSGPVQVRIDPVVDFTWAGGAPLSGIAPDTFSVRWTGEVEPRFSETYVIRVTSDDGVRLWVGGQLLIDQWNDHAARSDQATIAMQAGQRLPIVLEYYENTGQALIRLEWSSPSTPLGPIPINQLHPAPAVGSGTGLFATYFDDLGFSGANQRRVDPVVDFDWAGGVPLSGIGADTFSVRWAGEVQAQFSETVTFRTLSDDGVRLWVNGQLLIDQWNDHGATAHSGSIAVTAGQRYPIVMEFYENGGAAVARLRWSSAHVPLQAVPQSQLYPALIPGSGTGLTATYFDNRDFSGVSITRLDQFIAFDWSGGSPDSAIAPDTFSARWVGEVEPYLSETYTFTTISDDGIRVWIGDQLIIDHWTDHAASARSGSVVLTGGQRYPLRVEYYENGGAAVAKLLWASPSTPAGVVPTSQLYPATPIVPTVATPLLAPVGGTFVDLVAVTLTTATPGAVVRYTLDGSVPTAVSPVATGSVTIAQTATLMARGFLAGWNSSAAVGGTYVIVPSATAPTVAIPANATPGVVLGTATALNVLGAQVGQSESTLTYTWTVLTGAPTGFVIAPNGTNTAKQATAIFAHAGTYDLVATIRNAQGLTTTSPVRVVVSPTVTSVSVSPVLASVTVLGTQAFTVTVADQFAELIAAPGPVQWSVSAGGNISATGLVTAQSSPGGPFIVIATVGGQQAQALFSVVDTSTTLPLIAFAVGTSSISEGAGHAAIQVTLSPSHSQAVTVAYSVTGSATGGGDDYYLPNGVLTFVPGETTASIPLSIRDDSTVEADETVIVTLAAPANGVLGLPSEHILTIHDNDAITVQVVASDPNAAEAGHSGTFTFTRTGSLVAALPISFTIAGTAITIADYADLGTSALFPAGGATLTLPLTVMQDGLQEAEETVILTLVAGAGYGLGSSTSATATIVDDDVITIAAAPAITTEGASPIPGRFVVTRAGSTAEVLTVPVNVSGGTAASSDYNREPMGNAISVSAGQASAIITITPINDTIVEGAETVIATLAAGSGYTLGTQATATITILDDDVPTVSAAATIAFASEPSLQGLVTITRSVIANTTLDVTYDLTGSATNGVDYVLLTGLATIPADSLSATIAVIPLADAITDPDETVVLTLTPKTTYNVGTAASATVTIADSTVSIVATDADAAEPGGSNSTGSFTISRTGSMAFPLPVNVVWKGTAASASDFTADPVVTTNVIIPAGSMSVAITITPQSDELAEGIETAALTLLPGAYAIGSSGQGSVSLTDATLTVAVDRQTIGEADGFAAVFQITRSGNLANTVSVPITWGGTASKIAPADYEPSVTVTSVIIPAGSNVIEVRATPINDTLLEGDKTITLTIGSVGGYALTPALSAAITIIDDETPVISIAVVDGAIGEAGPDVGVFRVTRSVMTASPLPVQVRHGGTATVTSDYTAVPALAGTTTTITITIPTSATSLDVVITPAADTISEDAETVTLAVVAGTGYRLADATGSLASMSIADDDMPRLSVVATASTAAEGGTGGVFTITRIGNLVPVLSAAIDFTGSTATNGSDFTAIPLTIVLPSGASTIPVYVSPIDDTLVEIGETVQLTLKAGTGYMVGTPAAAMVTIADNDLPTVTIAAGAPAAEQAVPMPGTFVITRTGTSGTLPITVAFTGTASAGDYTRSPATISIPVGSASTTVTITPVDDVASEGDETVIAIIQPASGYVVGLSKEATITIADDEMPTVSIVAIDPVAGEGGNDTGAFRISRSAYNASPLTIPILLSGSARLGVDVSLIGNSITIPPGNASTDLAVVAKDDKEMEFDESVTITLTEGSSWVVSNARSATVTIRSDDIPAPIVAYQRTSTALSELIGSIPPGFRITSLVTSCPTPGCSISSAIEGEIFIARLSGPAASRATGILQFKDERGNIGSACSVGVVFPSSGTTENGSPTELPPGKPNVTVVVSPGALTGDKTGEYEKKSTHFSNKGKSDSKITVTATASASLGTITKVRLFCSDGRSFSGDGSSLTEQIEFPVEGLVEFTATAIAENDGIHRTGDSKGPVRLMVDRTPPRVIFRPAKRFWADPNIPEMFPLVPDWSTEDALSRDISLLHYSNLVYLNNNPELGATGNKELRRSKGWYYYNKADFEVTAEVVDESYCEEFDAGYPILGTGVVPVTTTKRPRDTITITEFPDLLLLKVRDQAGNTSDGQGVDRSNQLNFRYADAPVVYQWGADEPPEMTFSSPIRWIGLYNAFVPELWQGPSPNRAGRLLAGNTWNTDWQLASDIDLSGNVLKWDTNEAPDYTPLSMNFLGRDECGNIASVPYKFALQPIDFYYSASYNGEGVSFKIPDDGSSSTFAYVHREALTFDLIVNTHTLSGGQAGFQKATVGFEYQNIETGISSVAPIAGNVTPKWLWEEFESNVTEEYRLFSYSPLSPGSYDQNRRFGPAVMTVPASWNRSTSMDFRIQDAGIAQVTTGYTSSTAGISFSPTTQVQRQGAALTGKVQVTRPLGTGSK